VRYLFVCKIFFLQESKDSTVNWQS
jgi:hypothetical protein